MLALVALAVIHAMFLAAQTVTDSELELKLRSVRTDVRERGDGKEQARDERSEHFDDAGDVHRVGGNHAPALRIRVEPIADELWVRRTRARQAHDSDAIARGCMAAHACEHHAAKLPESIFDHLKCAKREEMKHSLDKQSERTQLSAADAPIACVADRPTANSSACVDSTPVIEPRTELTTVHLVYAK